MSKVIEENGKKTKKRKGLKIALIATAVLAGGAVAYKKSEGFKKVVDGAVGAAGKLFKKKEEATTEETAPMTTKKEYSYDGYNRKRGGYSSDHRHYNN